MNRAVLLCLSCLGALFGPAALSAAGPEPLIVSLAYVGDAHHTALEGIRQGLDEANVQGRFLGQEYRLDLIDPAAASGADYSKYLAVMTTADKDALLALADRAGKRPVFNLALDDDDLRSACRPNLLHVVPSATMKRNAVAQWDKAHAGAKVEASAWRADYVKYAGRDLNKRFMKTFQRPMDDAAWAGWAAVKMTSDSVARGEAGDASALLDFLKTRLSFDGQKGVEMSFRDTGQLRQTLMLSENGKLVGDAPVRGVAAPDDLDSLDTLNCAK